jgi:hypothetical protein
VKITHGVLASEQSLCDVDKVVGGLVVEVAGDPNGGRPCGSGDCQGIGHGFSWGSVAELFLSARADSAANSRRRQRGNSLRLVNPKGRERKTMWRPKHPGRCGMSAVQVTKPLNRASSSVKRSAMRKSTTWATSSEARTSQGGGEVSFAASDLDIRHLWVSRSRYGQQYKRRRCYDGPDPIGRLFGAR